MQAVPGTAVFKLVKTINNNPPYVMVLGPILSVIASATAEIIHFWNLTQVNTSH